MLKISELSPPKGSKKAKKRVGRGPGSGHGKTSCRGQKGQKSRSGGSIRPGFEGGQMPLQRRLPKRGFTNIFRKKFTIINVGSLNRFEPNTKIDPETLKRAGLIKHLQDNIKLLGEGDISHPLVIRVHKASRSAHSKIEAVGGKLEILK